MKYFAGIDTSAYTTSLAVVDEKERLITEVREPVQVKKGMRGVRQSEAVFHHLMQVPRLWKEIVSRLNNEGVNHLEAVAASIKPRPVEDSYMPVFRAGESFAAFLASTMGIPVVESTHQEGHLLAGLWEQQLPPGVYLAFHLSGGTTELLKIVFEDNGIKEVTVAGGSRDLSAGQFVDRVGVAMGLDFPAGPGLEKLSRKKSHPGEDLRLTVSVDDTWTSFSGPASQAVRLWERGCSAAELARAVELCLARALLGCLQNAVGKTKADGVLLVGGVASNRRISEIIHREAHLPAYVVDSSYAVDNAVGVALHACKIFRN